MDSIKKFEARVSFVCEKNLADELAITRKRLRKSKSVIIREALFDYFAKKQEQKQ
jgi:predicted transcriptional regulator